MRYLVHPVEVPRIDELPTYIRLTPTSTKGYLYILLLRRTSLERALPLSYLSERWKDNQTSNEDLFLVHQSTTTFPPVQHLWPHQLYYEAWPIEISVPWRLTPHIMIACHDNVVTSLTEMTSFFTTLFYHHHRVMTMMMILFSFTIVGVFVVWIWREDFVQEEENIVWYVLFSLGHIHIIYYYCILIDIPIHIHIIANMTRRRQPRKRIWVSPVRTISMMEEGKLVDGWCVLFSRLFFFYTILHTCYV